MSQSPDTRGLHRFATLTAMATLFLISIGGMVTSHGAGMAVPDWPNTYGYNVFFFPFSSWIGGIFYEHSHRLAGSLVGLLTVVLAAWFYGRRSRPVLRWMGVGLLLGGVAVELTLPKWWQDAVVLGATGVVVLAVGFFWPRSEPQPRWLRRLALLALGLVILQGVLGGLRVTLFRDDIGIFHAALAQLFFVLTGALALFTSCWWRRLGESTQPVCSSGFSRSGPSELSRQPGPPEGGTTNLCVLYSAVTLLVLSQLILGATMRHQHAGLAVPDFPLAYGKLWPATDPDSVAASNRARLETQALNDITTKHILVHMAHRLTAVAVVLAIGVSWWLTRRKLARGHPSRRLGAIWFALVLVQFGLGAWTVWSNRAADITTLHVVMGALTLLTGAMLTLVSFRCVSPARLRIAAPLPAACTDSRSFA
jgi:cytochrome c oxidase assembly protein subunit 15